MKGLIGRKLGMTRVFDEEGRSVPVTVLECGPCPITQIKTVEADGYTALQIGFGARKENRTSRALAGHLRGIETRPVRLMREFRIDSSEGYERGQQLTVEVFADVEQVKVTGVSKGRGFAGVHKRHGFHGGRETHGSNSHRVTGAIGACATPSRTMRGRKMPGHYGGVRSTVTNLRVVKVDPDNNLLYVKGAVPGARNGYIRVEAAGL